MAESHQGVRRAPRGPVRTRGSGADEGVRPTVSYVANF